MCGLVGYFGPWSGDWPALLKRAADTIVHRGPDDSGLWYNAQHGIGLAHRRLSILDLSQAGHQPMTSACGQYVIAFNGEIYNHLELRDELARARGLAEGAGGHSALPWRGHADTETILACLSRWGIEKTLNRLVGMFAFAVWDAQSEALTLARDALGEKPLYYAWLGRGLCFGSELKALRSFPDFNTTVDPDALNQYLNNAAGCVPAPQCIYQDSFKLPPGTSVTFDRKHLAHRSLPGSVPYWRLEDTISAGLGDSSGPLSMAASVDALSSALTHVVSSQMLADVPVGAFLSGGIDSSLIVAIMSQIAHEPVRTFTVGFTDERFNEAPYAAAIAKHLGTTHTELYVDAAMTREVIPTLGSVYCEPFADQSQIPTVLIARLASEHVKVCLSGDGGDEVFGGYRRYFETMRLWEKRSRLPDPLRRSSAALLGKLSPTSVGRLAGMLKAFLPSRLGSRVTSDSLQLIIRLMSQGQFAGFYNQLFSSSWFTREIITERNKRMRDIAEQRLPPDHLMEQMMAGDTVSYLPDDILVKVDRAAMASSLETRIPFLDKRIVDLAWRLPRQNKFDQHAGKLILRQLAEKHIPRALFDRPKKGFSVPIGSWLRGPLKPWAHDLLHPGRINREGYLDAALVEKRWRDHQSGAADWQYELWNVLMFQSWLDASGAPATSHSISNVAVVD